MSLLTDKVETRYPAVVALEPATSAAERRPESLVHLQVPAIKEVPRKGGYIHAIERRLQQVEALMGTIIGSTDPRAQGLLRDLSQDALAKQIIHKVDHGPFGPKGRVSHPFGSTKEDFLASIVRSAEDPRTDAPGSRRSRRGRESQQDDLVMTSPNNAWQSRLQDLLLKSPSAAALNSPSRSAVATSLGTPSEEENFELSLPHTPSRQISSLGLDIAWHSSVSPSPKPRVATKLLNPSPVMHTNTLKVPHGQVLPQALAGVSYGGMGVSPSDTYGPYHWQGEQMSMGGMEFGFPTDGLASFAAGQAEWSTSGSDADALHMDFVNGL
ncbi:hypothetical protein EWM64_g952 [Hericium alpestre]|uniref:Uncharacterized protein n=1 Tax=Hericium alpestre TaxID=135208 RepID=A0A4Z0A945_9AGAM|nr:hypothetical protein EWM64_g952 [Hericium alpestre]